MGTLTLVITSSSVPLTLLLVMIC